MRLSDGETGEYQNPWSITSGGKAEWVRDGSSGKGGELAKRYVNGSFLGYWQIIKKLS